MIYNLYKVLIDELKNVVPMRDYHDPVLDEKLNQLEDEIALLYIKKQKDKKGIRTLGNEIRYSPRIKEIFCADNDFELVKFTFNRTDFLINFIKTIKKKTSKKIYLFIYSNSLKQESQLVDQTASTVEDISRQLAYLASVFVSKITLENVFIVEVTSFSKYHFKKSEEKYSKIIKNHGQHS